MKNNCKRDEGYFCFVYLLMSSQGGGVARSANGVVWMWIQEMLGRFQSRAGMPSVSEKV